MSRLPTDPDPSTYEHLIPFGYAFGRYLGNLKCHNPDGEYVYDIDKRASRCRDCAQKAFDTYVAPPPKDSAEAIVRDAIAILDVLIADREKVIGEECEIARDLRERCIAFV